MKPEVGASVIDKLGMIGKVKLSTDALGDDERQKLKVKTMLYFIIDAIIVLIVTITLRFQTDNWNDCVVHYLAWISCVGGFNLVSFITNIFTYRQIIQKRFKMWLLVVSSILEVGMVILSIYAPILAYRSNECIKTPEVAWISAILAAVMFIRCF